MKKIYLILFLLGTFQMFSQITSQERNEFLVKVKVESSNNSEPITDAQVSVNSRNYNYSFIDRRYNIKARAGDELIVRHPDFETVYYTIKDDEDIKIKVEGFVRKSKPRKTSKSIISKRAKVDLYPTYLDSANFFKNKDIDKSISFIEKTLKTNPSRQRKASSYKTLADIYFYWKQYDLAVQNYRESLKYMNTQSVRLSLAKSQYFLGEFKESKQTYLSLLKGKLSVYEKLTVHEGLGDVYTKEKEYTKAKESYNKALVIAKENLITPKITDLNSKLAGVFALQGETEKANKYFNNSLDLASKENAKRSLKEQEKVADFYNQSQRYDEEIQLRKESLKNTDDIVVTEMEKQESIVDSITSQKINYKIGNAYVLKEDYKEAIPFLKKSISEADKNEDLIIQKDATRKLSEVYATVGNYSEALKSYQDYVKLVDTLYSKKEQEIQQVKRFSKRISENQNRITSLEKDKALNDSKINLAYKDQQLAEESYMRQQIIIYSLVAGILLMSLLAYFMFRTNREQKLANNLLALKSMRSQMNPHFIFNALNSVNSFIAVNDERSANRYLSEFSVLMRSVLENSDEDFIPLSKEIELLELYVKLEHNRFKDKFDYTIKIDEQIRLEEYSIPPMLLQPYIENAIWHGLRYKEEKGSLKISMNQKNEDSIVILIEDDGVGRKKSKEMKTKNQLKQKSKGMSTIQNRIAILNDMYQDKISVLVTDVFEDESGTRVELILKKD
ncbi:histidine kinase [Tenacibaculum holothuriorum]|uniref:Histidine kinase n=1 Tax=Tenacibaculum holothuriorum TaxID=1635173 RepID=A0A1Y2PA90_9FLAO|nr:histidine kinase [Tenacibaculum holothuriorum]OSY87374.1 histidine kinase [Tenacibaculum holothuriorum]